MAHPFFVVESRIERISRLQGFVSESYRGLFFFKFPLEKSKKESVLIRSIR